MKKWQTILAIVVALFTIIGGVYGFTNMFATNKRVDKVEITTDKKFNDFETEVAGAIQNTQMKSTYQFYQLQYDKLTRDMLDIQRQLRRDPENTLLRQDYQDVKQERNRIKDKMEKLMEKIN